MKTMLELPDIAVLNETLSYDPETGVFFWKERPRSHFTTDGGWKRFNQKLAGQPAGHKHVDRDGVPTAIIIRGTFSGKDSWFLAHRLAYVLMGVEIPAGMEVDHRNLDPFDNRWSNLRLATAAQNSANKPAQPRKKLEHLGLPKGVTIWGKRFKTQIALGGKKRHVGVYDTPEEAGAAYLAEAEKAVGQFARG